MRGMGKAMMGTGEATGEERARHAAEAAIANPLLDDVSMQGARGLLISITGGRGDLTLYEVDEAASRIREEVAGDANIIVGATFDDGLDGVIRVSVVATGTEAAMVQAMEPVKPNPARALTAKRSDGATAGDDQEDAEHGDLPADLDNQVEAAISRAIRSTTGSGRADDDDDIVVEPYTPTTVRAHEPIDDLPLAPVASESDEPNMHIPTHAQRPETQRRMPRADEVQQQVHPGSGNERGRQGGHEPRNARALFKRLASNVGLSLQPGDKRDNASSASSASNASEPPLKPADDAAARSAIESSPDRDSFAQSGAKGQTDHLGRANVQHPKKDHLEIPSFLKKHG